MADDLEQSEAWAIDAMRRVSPLPDRRPPWQWCEEHVRSIPYSPIPGPFRVHNSPWLREVMEAIVDPTIRVGVTIAAVQASKTTGPELALNYIIANLPGPTLWLDQTDDDAKDQSQSRLSKLMEQCQPVVDLFPLNRHDKKAGATHFANGMSLWVRGAHNKTNLQRRSIRWLFGDETWRWPQGHMKEAKARVTAFGWLGKCWFMSQGGQTDDDTHKEWLQTDRREWSVCCESCGARWPFKWANVEFDSKAAKRGEDYDFGIIHQTTQLKCEACGHHHADTDATRRRLNSTGTFIASNPTPSRGYAGFTWNALATMTWGDLAEEYLRAKASMRRGDLSDIKAFHQKRLANFWSDETEDFKLEIRTADYKAGAAWEQVGTWRGKRMVFLTVDVQEDSYWYVVRAWAINGNSRLIDCGQLHTEADILDVQAKYEVDKDLVFLDVGGRLGTVTSGPICIRHGFVGLRGDQRESWNHLVRDKDTRQITGRIRRFYSPRVDRACGGTKTFREHYFSTLNIKDILNRLRHNQDPARGATWEVFAGVPDEYLKQMESERRTKKGNSWEWQIVGRRANHLWDCEVMQTCVAVMLKVIGRETMSVAETSAPVS